MQAIIDPESRVRHAHHDALRLWLRLFTCSQLIERTIRVRLRREYDTTLPRFDLMAQLERNPDGLKMGELSKRLMVTGGNITGVTDQLVREGFVKRQPMSADRRAFAVQLTTKGKRAFDAMASAHEQWVIDLLAGLTVAERRSLYALLGRAKAAVRLSGGNTR
ncbi:MAG TPA: MarR family transcriptional regulator [Casimicrobiaceae bacterium]|jgi:DNA-binding MarR family transcriptional regulator|nr:MarR family transcriptional regulator [Casimicrobiaceae bacterium]